jgi:hypothetical protein
MKDLARIALPNGDTIVLLEWEGQPETFCNLQRQNAKGDVMWTATPPKPLDAVWVTARLENGRLLANSYSGYLDEIDCSSGRVLKRTFVK